MPDRLVVDLSGDGQATVLSWPDGGHRGDLAPDHGSSLPAEVEAALAARDATQRPDRYLDPVSLASLIVSIASLARTIYNDRRMHSPEPPPSESIARQVRITLREHDTALLPGTGPITEITRHGKPLA